MPLLKKLLIVGSLAALTFCSCTKLSKFNGVDTAAWDPDLALPLINSQITINDVLDRFETGGFIDIASDGFITVQYQGNVLSVDGTQMTSLSDFTIPMIDSSVAAQAAFPAGDLINTFILKNGTASYTLQSGVNTAVQVVLSIPNAIKNGNIVSKTVTLPDNTPVTGTIDLAGVNFSLQSNNAFLVKYNATKVSDNSRILLNSANMAFSNMNFSYIEGYIGNYNFALPEDTIVLDVFKNAVSGDIYFNDPSLSVIIKNSFGFPIGLTFNKLQTQNALGTSPMNLTALQGQINLNYPSITEKGQQKETTITVDKTSNLPQIIASAPQQIIYQIDAVANPSGTQSPNLHFFDTSKFNVDVDIKLPVDGWVKSFKIEKSFNLDLSIYEEFDEVAFKLVTDNGFPTQAIIQLYFEDNNGVVIDSLFRTADPIVLKGASVDANGKVATPERADLFSQFSQSEYENIRTRSTKVRLSARLNTTDAPNSSVRYYSFYELGIKLGAQGNLNIENL